MIDWDYQAFIEQIDIELPYRLWSEEERVYRQFRTAQEIVDFVPDGKVIKWDIR